MVSEINEAEYRNVTLEYGMQRATGGVGPKRRYTRLLSQINSAGESTDLRESLPLPHADNGGHTTVFTGGIEVASYALLARGIDVAVWVFLDGHGDVHGPRNIIGHRSGRGNQRLGPLENVQVYATDPRHEFEGKSHGLCKHEKHVSARHELLTLKEFIPLYQEDEEHASYRRHGSIFCGICGGFAIRRLDEQQFAYYMTSIRQAHALLDHR